MPEPATLFLIIASTAISAIASPRPPKPPPLEKPPAAPELEDPAISAARQRQLSASRNAGRGGTIIAGAGASKSLEVETQTLLGGSS